MYAAGFAPEKSEIVMGEPIYLDFNLTNTSGKRIFLSVAGNQWGLGAAFRIQALDANGESVPDLLGNRTFSFSTVVGGIQSSSRAAFTWTGCIYRFLSSF